MGKVNPSSLLSPGQIAQNVYDENTDRIRVDAQYTSTIAGELEVSIDSTEDSVAIGDVSGNKVTTTTVGPKVGLDVNIAAGTVTLSNTSIEIKGATDSTLIGNNTNRLLVDGSTVTQPVSVASLPLPTGASTSALQTTGNTSLASIDSKLTSPITVTGTVTANAGSGTFLVDGSAHTQPVSATSLPLPTNAAQETGGHLASLDTKLPSQGQALSSASLPVVLPAAQITTLTPPTTVTVIQPTGANLHVDIDNFPATQPVSGTVAVTQSTSPWVVSGTITANAGTGTLLVDGSAHTQPVSGTVTANAGTNLNTSALALESGGHLASIDTKTPALGQALAAGSVPVVLTAAQLTTLTPLTTVTVTQATGTNLHTTVDNFPATQPVSGTVTVNQGTSPWVGNTSQFGGSNVVTGTGNSGAGIPRVTVSNDSSITNISGTISLPTGAATAANQTTANTSLSSIVTSLSSPLVTVGAAATSSGVVSSNGNAIADGPLLSKYSNVSVMVYGTFVATVTFMGSNDGTNYFNVAGELLNAPSTTPNASWISTVGIFNIPIKFIFFEVVISNYVSGTVNVVTQYQSTSPIALNRAGAKSGTSVVTSVNASASNVSLLVSNTLRKAAYFFNDSTSVAFLKLGTTASATSYTVRMVPNAFVTIDLDPAYTGEVDAIWTTANGAMRVTELT